MVESARLKRCPCPEHGGPNPLPVSEFGKDRSRPDGLNRRCKACARRASARWAKANPEKGRRRLANWKQANPEKVREVQRRSRQKTRDQVFDHYGWVCSCPGCGATEKLTVDHVNGDGAAHRLELFGNANSTGGSRWYRWIVAQGFPDYLQVLCNPCNKSKGDTPACHLDHLGTGLKRCPCSDHVGPNPLPLSEFGKRNDHRDGLEYFCRACAARRRRARRAEQAQITKAAAHADR
jgi:hypothetical protein